MIGIGLCWTPFICPIKSFFVTTIGFLLVYLAFSSLLIYFITYEKINDKLDKYLTKYTVDAVSKIGYCSYSICIIHTFINTIESAFLADYIMLNSVVRFILTSGISVIIGFFMTEKIEKYILILRNKYYPSKA